MSGDDGLREAIARWLWAMDATPGAVWDEWPDEHAEYLSKADDYAADLPWLAALRAKAAGYDRVWELVDRWMRLGDVPMAVAVRRALDGGVE